MYNLTGFKNMSQSCFTTKLEENNTFFAYEPWAEFILRKTLYNLSLYDPMCNSGKCNYPKIFVDFFVFYKITGLDV